MAPTKSTSVDALERQIVQKLVESGEWERIKSQLFSKLNESGWTDEVRVKSKERAQRSPPATFATLLGEVGGVATSVPLAVRREVMALIRGYLEQQFE